MVDNMKVHGEITRCMAEEFLCGQMVVSIKGRMLTTKNKGMVNLVGLMADLTKDNGKMGSRMVEEHTETNKEYKR